MPDFALRLIVPSPRFSRAVILTAFLLFSGCAVQGPKQAGVLPGVEVYAPIDAPVETVGEPYQPIDDGLPLTRAELAAFESTGVLDANLSMEEKQIVELHFKHFLHNNRKTVERFLKRSELYLTFVTRVFRDRGMPEELACLAFVESGFNPNAISRAGAGGMWQFMPYTGKKYGLYQDRWLDERRDPYKATEAAAAYLTKLYEYFNKDWHLAISAYNAGEGKIGRALAGTDSTTFFELCRKNGLLDGKTQLKEETQRYLPRFLAFTKILRNHEALGFPRIDPQNALDAVAVKVPAGVDLKRFARDINLDWERFSGLNPAYLRSVSPPSAATQARVPAAREQDAQAWLRQKNISLYAGWRDYRVRGGDSMGRIAQRTGTSAALLRQANNKPNDGLRVGEFLLVPGSPKVARLTLAKLGPGASPSLSPSAGPASAPDSTPAAMPRVSYPREAKPADGRSGVHTVVSGDTLFSLARVYHTSVNALARLNGILPGSTLKLGQRLRLP
ncbi:MAG: transglycosylase SLT domain-containing protein [Deltaproteobacteria bacterium]|jgi:membrane-bound lytic murein transglycosylase D|nr:transglycosylase SLT domain-containing protein [Deltaproteobacteria bacterium]